MTTDRRRHAGRSGGARVRAGAAATAALALSGVLAGLLWLPAQAASTPGPESSAGPSRPVSSTASQDDLSPSGDPPALGASPPASSGTDTTGLGPVPTDPAARAAYLVELRKRIAVAQSEHQAAARGLDEATSAATQAARVAVAAEQRASLARDRLTLWASYLYRVSGNTGLILALFNDPASDPAEFLRGAVDAQTFSDGFIRDLTEAHDAVVAARAASAEATVLQQAALDRAGAAETARQALLALLVPAQAVTAPIVAKPVASSAGATGPQQVIDGRACPTRARSGTLRDGSADLGVLQLCRRAVAEAATPQAALAIQAAFQMLGAPYACQGIGRQDPFRFDCSSLVSRAYFLGAGIDTAGTSWAPSTRDMVPWDGVPLAWWASFVDPRNVRPGDLVLYDTGGAAYRHVVMYIGNGFMLHTNACGDVAHISSFWGFQTGGHRSFLVVRRVIAPGGYRVPDPKPIPTGGAVIRTPDPGAGDPKVSVPVGPRPVVPTPTPPPVAPSETPSASSSPSTTSSEPRPTVPTTSSPPPTSEPPSSPPPTSDPPTSPEPTTESPSGDGSSSAPVPDPTAT